MNKTIFVVAAFLSLIVAIYIATEELPLRYTNLAMLPGCACLLYAVLCMTIGALKSNVATSLIIALTFTRYTILPLLMVVSGFQTIMSHASLMHGQIAIWLMVYELVVVVGALIIANRRSVSKKRIYQEKEREDLLTFIVWGCLLFCVLIVGIFPDIKDAFKPIAEIGDEEFTLREETAEVAIGTMERAMRTMFSVVFNVTRIVWPIYILKYFIAHQYNRIFIAFVIGVITLLQFMLLTQTFAEAIVSALIVLLSVARLDPVLGRKINVTIPVFACCIIVLYFSARYQVSGGVSMYASNGPIGYATSIVSAYFTGVDNVSGIFNLPEDQSFAYLQSSMISTIPFNTTIFGPREFSFPVLYNEMNGVHGQISATIGNGYYYFGYLMAPIFSCLLTYYSVRLNKKAEQTTYLWMYVAYMFIAVVLALGIAMYNETISMSWVNGWGLPMLIIAVVCCKKRGIMLPR